MINLSETENNKTINQCREITRFLRAAGKPSRADGRWGKGAGEEETIRCRPLAAN